MDSTYASDCKKRSAVWNKEQHYYYSMPCKNWKCPYCAKNKKKDLYVRLRHGEISYNWPIKVHAVLTVKDKESDENIDRLFNDLITYLRRGVYVRVLQNEFWIDQNDKKHKKVIIIDKNQAIKTDRLIKRPHIKYIWVKEFQSERFLKTGIWYRHFHIIFNESINKYDLIPIWNHVSGEEYNYIYTRPIRAWDNGNYLLKYLTKEAFQKQFLNKERRYQASKGVLTPISKKKIATDTWVWITLNVARNLLRQYKANPQRFDTNFDKILFFTKMKDRFIRAEAAENFTIPNA